MLKRLAKILVFSMLPVVVFAAEDEGVGRVVALAGEVSVVHLDGSREILARRSAIAVGDRIVTSADAWLQVRFIDSAILSLSCESELEVRNYQYLDRNSDRSQLHLHKGKARTITGTIQRSNYQFTTDLAEIQPAGTDFEVAVIDAELQLFAVYDGGIRVATEWGEVTLGGTAQAQYARLALGEAPVHVALRPVQLGQGVLGGVDCL